MRFKILIVIFFFSLSSSLFSKNTLDENKIHKNLRCLVCQGQSVADSNSDFAQTLKSVVQDQINAGKTEKEIYEFLREKYGEWILYKPTFNKINSILWIFPYFALLLGGIFIFLLLKKKDYR